MEGNPAEHVPSLLNMQQLIPCQAQYEISGVNQGQLADRLSVKNSSISSKVALRTAGARLLKGRLFSCWRNAASGTSPKLDALLL